MCKFTYLLVWFLILPASAQKPLTMVEILSLETPENVRLSPDGSQALFEISTADWKTNRRVSHIWRIPSQGGEPVKMTNGSGETRPAWSPDGARFAFLRRSGRNTQVFAQRLSGGEAEQWTEHETSIAQLAWSKDGAEIYFVAPEKPRSWTGVDDAYLFEQNKPNSHLWAASAAGPRKERRLTEGSFDVREFSVASDGRSILYVAAPSPLLDDTVKAVCTVQ